MKRLSFIVLSMVGLTTSAFAAEPAMTFGIVNSMTCFNESKLGKQEQANLEGMKKQMSSLMEDTEKKLSEITTKLNDAEYLDGLSPEGEAELKANYQSLSEQIGPLPEPILPSAEPSAHEDWANCGREHHAASEKVAKQKKLTMIVNKDACFFYNAQLDISPLIVTEMDKLFDEEAKKAQATPTAAPAAAPAAILLLRRKNETRCEDIHRRTTGRAHRSAARWRSR